MSKPINNNQNESSASAHEARPISEKASSSDSYSKPITIEELDSMKFYLVQKSEGKHRMMIEMDLGFDIIERWKADIIARDKMYKEKIDKIDYEKFFNVEDYSEEGYEDGDYYNEWCTNKLKKELELK